ncbi:MAG: purine-nucleoside phosphorylase [Bacilli bacterium]|nr:purine-nucleoside phosphorylase [Bacilli bacterium]
MATPHINANKGDFAKVVLMPGDPLRAKMVAENFLVDAKLVTNVRGILGYTGYTKNGKKISVMASGMGQPSIAIYSHELYAEYGVESIIRIGTCGAYQPEIDLRDVLVCSTASTDSNLSNSLGLVGAYSAGADFELCEEAVKAAKAKGCRFHVGNILSSDIFYGFDPDGWKKWARLGVLGVEMESYALYVNAALMHKRALCLLTVSDSFCKSDILTSEERQNGLVNMIEVAIATAEKFCD